MVGASEPTTDALAGTGWRCSLFTRVHCHMPPLFVPPPPLCCPHQTHLEGAGIVFAIIWVSLCLREGQHHVGDPWGALALRQLSLEAAHRLLQLGQGCRTAGGVHVDVRGGDVAGADELGADAPKQLHVLQGQGQGSGRSSSRRGGQVQQQAERMRLLCCGRAGRRRQAAWMTASWMASPGIPHISCSSGLYPHTAQVKRTAQRPALTSRRMFGSVQSMRFRPLAFINSPQEAPMVARGPSGDRSCIKWAGRRVKGLLKDCGGQGAAGG